MGKNSRQSSSSATVLDRLSRSWTSAVIDVTSSCRDCSSIVALAVWPSWKQESATGRKAAVDAPTRPEPFHGSVPKAGRDRAVDPPPAIYRLSQQKCRRQNGACYRL